jgi:Domain of unknown function (DUF4249)
MDTKFFKKIKLGYFLLLTPFLLLSCVDSFDAGLKTNIRKLVVDGEISNKPGPYRVTLQNSSPFGTSDFAPPPFNATVSITDNLGNTETLKDFGNGKFETNTTQGVIGRSYTLEIKIGDKKIYKSTPQTIKKPVPIDKIYTEYVPYKGTSEVYIGGEMHVFLDTNDPATSGDYYRWNYTNYEQLDYCLETVNVNDAGRFYFQYFCCDPCWAINYCPGCIYLASDQYTNGKKINRQFIGKFPYNSVFSKFINIEQKSLTKENYFYWKEIDGQINNSGGIFDTPPANIQGNIFNKSDPSEQVLGFFAATGIVTVPYRANVNVVGINPVIPKRLDFKTVGTCAPCNEGLYRTKIKPTGY